jgi:hypothetical protein
VIDILCLVAALVAGILTIAFLAALVSRAWGFIELRWTLYHAGRPQDP